MASVRPLSLGCLVGAESDKRSPQGCSWQSPTAVLVNSATGAQNGVWFLNELPELDRYWRMSVVPSRQPLHLLKGSCPSHGRWHRLRPPWIYRVGLMVYSLMFQLGAPSFVIEDAGGNPLAQGTVTISP